MADCTHLLSVSPNRLEIGGDMPQPLSLKLAELSTEKELAETQDLQVILRQSERTVNVAAVSYQERVVTALVSPTELAGLHPGASEIVIQYHSGYGLRQASLPITLTRPVKFQSPAKIITFGSDPSAPLPRSVYLVPETSQYHAALGSMAILTFFPHPTMFSDAYRVCFFDPEQLDGQLVSNPTEPGKEPHCPLPGCPDCPMGIDRRIVV